MTAAKSIPKTEEVERLIRTVRYRAGASDEIEYHADKNVDPLRRGWLKLRAKSFKDTRKKNPKTGIAPELMSPVFVSRIKFPPGTEFQCHPDIAKLLIDKDQVDVI